MKDIRNSIKNNARLIKIITISVLSILLIIVLIQNSSTVKFHFLFWTFTVSRYLFLLLLFVIGFIIGWLLRSHFLHRKDLTNITNSSKQKP
ncbi:MAG: LapA family protein [Candidatus Scalindua sp.]